MEIEEYGLANVQRTGYPDGGMSAREEALTMSLEKNQRKLEEVQTERERANEDMASYEYMDFGLMEKVLDQYDKKIHLYETRCRLDREALEEIRDRRRF